MSKEQIKKVVKKVVESGGMKPVSKAMMEAGYSEKESLSKCARIKQTKTWKDLMEEYLPDDLLVKVHKEGLEATRLNGVGGMKIGIKKGEIEDFGHSDIETPDYAVRHKYLDTAYKLKGSYAAEKIDLTGSFLENLHDAADKETTD